MECELEALSVLSGHEERVWHISWSPDGTLLATSSSDKSVRIWQERGEEWDVVSILDDAHDRSVRCIEWSQCGRMLAAASFDATVTVWLKRVDETLLDWELIATLEGHENEVKRVSWNINTSLLASCARDKSIWLWDLDDEFRFELLTVLHGHAADVKAIAFARHREDLLLSASYDNSLILWLDDGDDWISIQKIENAHDSTIWDCRWLSKTDSALVSVSDDQTIKIWKTAQDDTNFVNVATYAQAHTRPIYSVDACSRSPDDADPKYYYIASAGGDNMLRVFQLESHQGSSEVQLLPLLSHQNAHPSDINCIRFHPVQQNIIASAGDDANIRLWRLNL